MFIYKYFDIILWGRELYIYIRIPFRILFCIVALNRCRQMGCCKPLGQAWVFGFQNWEETSTSLSKISASCYFGVFWCQLWSNFIWSVQGTLAAIIWHTIDIGCVQWSSVALTREQRNTILWGEVSQLWIHQVQNNCPHGFIL